MRVHPHAGVREHRGADLVTQGVGVLAAVAASGKQRGAAGGCQRRAELREVALDQGDATGRQRVFERLVVLRLVVLDDDVQGVACPARPDQVPLEIEARQIGDADRRHQQDLDRHRRLRQPCGPHRVLLPLRQGHQLGRQLHQGERRLRVVQCPQAGAILRRQAAPGCFETTDHRRHPVQVLRVGADVMTGNRLQGGRQVHDRRCRLAASALEQVAESVLEGVDGDQIGEAGQACRVTAAHHQRRGELADLVLPVP